MTNKNDVSQAGIVQANKYRAEFSGHGKSKGAAGYLDPHNKNFDHLGKRGDTLSITPPATGFGPITVAASWENVTPKPLSFISKLIGKKQSSGIDLDLGCLYELQDGTRGAVQPFGDMYGSYETAPFLHLSGDERTGDTQGDDEWVKINGQEWSKIKRLLVYVYIYEGADHWAEFHPQIQVRVPEQKTMIVTMSANHKDMDICAIATIENVRNGIRITNHSEYFHGQAEMDRAFGYGLGWDDGKKGE